MDELKAIFKIPQQSAEESNKRANEAIPKAWNIDYNISEYKIAIVGITDNRNNVEVSSSNDTTAAQIREQLNRTTLKNSKIVVDLGDIIEGKTVRDTQFALIYALNLLIESNIVPIVIGGSDDYTHALYMALQKEEDKIKHAHIDYKFDNEQTETETINSNNFFRHILTPQNRLSELKIIGSQASYAEIDNFGTNNNTIFSSYRLGWVRQNLFDTESLLRDINMVTIDTNAIRMSDNPANTKGLPTGLFADEICQIAWYAGLSGLIRILGIFNCYSNLDYRNAGTTLVAQIIWHFIDGFVNKQREEIDNNPNNFVYLYVSCESLPQELIFVRSKKTGRHWIVIEDQQKNKNYIPVSNNEYNDAVNNKVSDRIIHYLTVM